MIRLEAELIFQIGSFSNGLLSDYDALNETILDMHYSYYHTIALLTFSGSGGWDTRYAG
jgi:hypothetical protein